MSIAIVTEPLLADQERNTFSRVDYRPDIDGLRAVAAIAVMGAHAGLVPGGGVGVDIFFVISGFLISGIIFRELQLRRFSLLEFYARRVKRIFPALVTLLIAVWGVGRLLLSPSEFRQLGSDIAAGAGFVANFLFYFTVAERTRTAEYLLGNLWTLGVEEQFYLFWPVFLLLCWELRKKILVLISLITAVSFAWYVSTISSPPYAWLLPWNRLWQLSLGGAMAYSQLDCLAKRLQFTSEYGTPNSAFARLRSNPALAPTGTTLIALSIAGCFPNVIWQTMLSTLGAVLLISAGPKSWINRHIFGTRPMAFIGRLSYPLYLWHLPIFVFAAILEGRFEMADYEYKNMALSTKGLAAILSFVFAYATYKYIEEPIRSSSQTKRIAAALLTVTTLFAGFTYLASLWSSSFETLTK